MLFPQPSWRASLICSVNKNYNTRIIYFLTLCASFIDTFESLIDWNKEIWSMWIYSRDSWRLLKFITLLVRGQRVTLTWRASPKLTAPRVSRENTGDLIFWPRSQMISLNWHATRNTAGVFNEHTHTKTVLSILYVHESTFLTEAIFSVRWFDYLDFLFSQHV